jgi:hypothetical protein
MQIKKVQFKAMLKGFVLDPSATIKVNLGDFVIVDVDDRFRGEDLGVVTEVFTIEKFNKQRRDKKFKKFKNTSVNFVLEKF